MEVLMSISSAGNWPPSGSFLPENHSSSMRELPPAPPSTPRGRFYPPTDDMFPSLPRRTEEPMDSSPPINNPMNKPSPRLSGGGLNYVW